MNLFKKLATLFSATSGSSANWYPIAVQCNRCGEVLHAQINLSNDLSVEYDEAENVSGYICRKALLGEQRCFQQVEVTLTFDAKRKLIDRKVENGKFVDGA
jgi:lysyl-tRNA synthetase class I